MSDGDNTKKAKGGSSWSEHEVASFAAHFNLR
jgi:hypothetical protein